MITTHNTKYQYIRFYDGREIFAMVREIDNKLELHFPMSILCKPAVTGGITIHLGPDVPFTNDDKVLVDREDIVVASNAMQIATDIGRYDFAVQSGKIFYYNNVILDTKSFPIVEVYARPRKSQDLTFLFF